MYENCIIMFRMVNINTTEKKNPHEQIIITEDMNETL